MRLVFSLSQGRDVPAGTWRNPGVFEVRLPNTVTRLPVLSAQMVAQRPIADFVASVPSRTRDLVLAVRLADPADCRVTSDAVAKTVTVEARSTGTPPPPAAEMPPRGGPGGPRRGPGAGPGGPLGPGRSETARPERPRGPFGSQTITAQFVETDLRLILEALIEQGDASILLQPDVEGTYSLVLRQVTLEQALDSICEAFGLCWTLLPGDIVLVGTESELGDRSVEQGANLPAGWTVTEAAELLAVEYPEVTVARQLDAVPAAGPLPLRGALRYVGAARRYLAALQPKGDGVAPAPPTPDRVTSRYYPRYFTVEDARAKLSSVFPDLDAKPDHELGFLGLSGPRSAVASALRYLDSVDLEPNGSRESAEPAQPAAAEEPAPAPTPSPADDVDSW